MHLQALQLFSFWDTHPGFTSTCQCVPTTPNPLAAEQEEPPTGKLQQQAYWHSLSQQLSTTSWFIHRSLGIICAYKCLF